MSNLTHSLIKSYLTFNSFRGQYKLKKLLPNTDNVLRSVLMYHGIDDNEWTPLDIPLQSFFDEIAFYQQQGYEIKASSALGDNTVERPVLVLTFDDGNKNTLSVLRELVAREINFTIAICPGVIDQQGVYWFEELLARIKSLNHHDLDKSFTELEQCKLKYFAGEITRQQLLEDYRSKTQSASKRELYVSQAVHENLDWSELKQLVDTGYCEIASHTLFHDALTTLSPEQLQIDLMSCNQRIEQELGITCKQFICPFGDYSSEYQEVLDMCGYTRTYLSNNKINIFDSSSHKIVDRLKGVGFGNFSLRYFEYLWLQNHRVN